MYVDSNKIIQETKNVFFSSEQQKEKYNLIDKFISEEEYKGIHTDPLVSLDLKIDLELFANEISQYHNWFEQWGNEHTDLPRQGLALVNQFGHLQTNDPINGSLYEWNKLNPEQPILETDCKRPTEVMWIESLEPLKIFKDHWCRSNILLWDKGAEFKPHIDTLIPSPWLRLWGTTSNDVKLRFCLNNEMIEHPDVEPGRLYLIDTSLVHDAKCYGNPTLQFFLSVLPSALDLIKSLSKK